MKTALCLFGIIGGTEGKNGKGEVVDYEKCYDHYKKYVIDPNNADVFIHCWNPEHQAALDRLYQPKLSLYEGQKDYGYHKDESAHRVMSRWESHHHAIYQKRMHEKYMEFEYDAVIVGRFDLMFFKPLLMDQYDMRYFWASHWNTPPLNKNIKKKGHPGKADRVNRSLNKEGYLDLWFFSNSKMMDYFSLVFFSMQSGKIGLSQHKGGWDHIKLKQDPLTITKFTMYRWFDFELYRWKALHCYE